MRGMGRALVVAVVVLAAVGARADVDDTERARARFEAGRALYQIGSYEDAIREFNAGYALSQRPRFLVNLGQCYRKLGQLDKARELYRKFLAVAPPRDPERKGVEKVLDEIERQLATPPPPADHPRTAAPGASPASTAPASAALVATPAPARSSRRHAAWAVPLALVVAGAAIGLGVYFGTQSCDGSIGCIHAGH